MFSRSILLLSAVLLFFIWGNSRSKIDMYKTHKNDYVAIEKITSEDTIKTDSIKNEKIRGDINNGRRLFSMTCRACHNINTESFGPALKGILDRAPNKQWIYDFIRNSTELIASGDEYANEIFDEFGQERMTHFPGFTDNELDDILAYIVAETKEEKNE